MFRIVLLVSFLLIGVLPSFARGSVFHSFQSASIRKGELIDKIECRDNPAQSYALFLPSSYTPDRNWPILYAFDPGARGTIPVERFKEAAEKYGWIVAGSNNSRNGPWPPTANSWNAIYLDTHERFRIDDRRVYVTGFSGGARVALTIAALCKDCIAGVIASGAGFPARMLPDSSMHFLFFAAVGSDDFNFPEVTGLEDSLKQAGITHHIEVFNGSHEWPPSDVSMSAIEWMEFWAMKAGLRVRDENLISKVSQRESSREVNNAIREEQPFIKKQRELESTLLSLISQMRSATRQESLSSSPADPLPEVRTDELRFHDVISKLQQQSKAPEDSGTRRVARRVLGGVFIGLIEEGLNLLENTRSYREAAASFRLASEVNPDRFGPFFYLAAAYAMSGDKKQSLRALSTAVDKGLSDAKAVSENKWFVSLRNDARYAEILVRLTRR
jgi:pimeloyl-ACP methyl ester carboxylesterase